MALEGNVVVGIDPGKKGFMCMLPLDGGSPEFAAIPVIREKRGKPQFDVGGSRRILAEWTDRYEVRRAVIEKQQCYPGQGAVSAYSIGAGYYMLLGLTTAMGIPTECPHPKTWQKDMLRDVPGRDTKTRSLIAAGRLFPGVDLRRTDHANSKPCADKSDALLIAEWGRRRIME